MRSGDGDDNGGCGAGLAGNRDSSGKGSVAQLLEMVCVEAGRRPGAELRLFANARPYIGGFPCPIVGNNPFVLHLHEDGFVSLAPDTVANATLHQRLGPIGLLSERQPLHLVVKCLHGSNAKLEEPHPRLRQIVWELGGLFERSLWASTRRGQCTGRTALARTGPSTHGLLRSCARIVARRSELRRTSRRSCRWPQIGVASAPRACSGRWP